MSNICALFILSQFKKNPKLFLYGVLFFSTLAVCILLLLLLMAGDLQKNVLYISVFITSVYTISKKLNSRYIFK